MSTRASVIIRDGSSTLYFYRHSDGYLECAGESLKEFVKGYDTVMRLDAMQSAGWLVLHGHVEYNPKKPCKPNPTDSYMSWKVGAYEPADKLMSDVEYVYVIDLEERELTVRKPKSSFWEEPILENTTPIKGYKARFASKLGGFT